MENFYEGLRPGDQAQFNNPTTPPPGYKEFYNDLVQYTRTQDITSFCADITFYNSGTSNMTVLGFPLVPGQGIAFSANENELDTTRYTIRFNGAGQNICSVFRKVYKKQS